MSSEQKTEFLTEEQIDEHYKDLQQLLRIMRKWKVESVTIDLESNETRMVFNETSPTATTFGMSTFFGVHPNE